MEMTYEAVFRTALSPLQCTAAGLVRATLWLLDALHKRL